MITKTNIKISVVAMIASFCLSGCANFPRISSAVQDFGPRYHPENLYVRGKNFPTSIRRVAVLPVSTSGDTASLADGVETLEPVLHSELSKSRRFEVIPVSCAQMSQWTGRSAWRMDESLPENFFKTIREATGCDAVLFCQLTRYQAYQPLATGWKLGLVETPQGQVVWTNAFRGQIVWAVDEVMDAGNPSVANGARSYYMKNLHYEGPAPEPAVILSSPARFGQYTLSSLIGTLPERTGRN